MRYSCISLLLCLFLAACSSPTREPAVLNAEEQAALAFLKKDPFMRIASVERSAEGNVIVKTIQGNKRIFYRITANTDATPKEMIELVSPHVLYKKNF